MRACMPSLHAVACCAMLVSALPLSAKAPDALSKQPAAPASPPAPAITVREVIDAPEAAWQRFLAQARYPAVYEAYDALGKVGYSLLDVDAEACGRHRDALDRAVALAPVSIAVHRARLLCAEANGDDAAAEEAIQALASLSRLALADGREPFWPRPIRVLGPIDAYALLANSGLQYRYDRFELPRAQRHFPLRIAAWDPAARTERHLVFDYIDVVHQLSRDDTYSGFPVQRQLLAESFVQAQADAGEAQGIDWQASKAARWIDDPADRQAALRPGAEAGGLLSLADWLAFCVRTPSPGCGDEAVDLLLPFAEKGYAAHIVLLSMAHAGGAGVERDESAAAALLDAAIRQWHGDGALLLFAQAWTPTGQPPPAFLRERVAARVAAGSAVAGAISALWKLGDEDAPRLDPAEVRALTDAGNNGIGMGYALLANDHQRRDEALVSNAWLKFAADAGDGDAQAGLGIHAFEAARSQAQRDEALRQVAQGAQGGAVAGMRFMAHRANRHQRWADVEAWLMGAAREGYIDAILDLGAVYERERPGTRGGMQQAIDGYRSLSDHDDQAEARRRLAQMAIEGRGIERDPAQAERWLRQDAEKGDGVSAAQLGLSHLVGDFGARDEAEGIRWMERAIADGNADAYVGYGSWHFYRNGNAPQTRRRGIELWLEGAEAKADWALNNAAWALCTAPEPEIFDAARGLDLARRMQNEEADLAPAKLDTVAACHAATGDFEEAVALQQEVVESLTDEERSAQATEGVDTMVGRLALYRTGERYREPHRDPDADWE